MSRNWLKPSTIFLIACRIEGQLYYLSNQSSINNAIRLDKDLKYSNIDNFLFTVQVYEEYQCSIPRRFYQPLLLRHKYSNKYLNFIQEMGDENHEGCKLSLSHEKVRWTMQPCFKYQIKNTQNIQFAERIFIGQQYYQDSSSKSLFIKKYLNEQTQVQTYDLLFGFHAKAQMMFIRYHDEDSITFHFGQYIKIYHQESYAYLVDSTPISAIFNMGEQKQQKYAISFKNQNEKIGESFLNDIWIVQEATSIKGNLNINGTIRMNIEIRLKNALTQQYLTLFDNSTDDENFNMIGEKEESIYSIFKLEPVNNDKVISEDVQIRVKHSIIYQYMAVSRYRESHGLIDIKMDKIPQDQHFYEFQAIPFQIELVIFFLVSLKKQLLNINYLLSQDINSNTLPLIKQLYLSIQSDMSSIDKMEANVDILKEQLNHFIPLIVSIITKLQEKGKQLGASNISLEIIGFNYKLLIRIAKNHQKNQMKVFQYIHNFLKNLFQQLYVQQLLTQILKNNMKLLYHLSEKNNELNGNNIIQTIIQNLTSQQKDNNYWKKMLKIIELLKVIVKIFDQFIDINQRLIALQLFGQKKLFNHLFFSIKIKKSQFYIHHPTSNIQMPINNFKQPSIRDLIAKIISFLVSLCEDRNIISKKLIQNYLHSHEEQQDAQKNNWNRPEDIKIIINSFYIRNQGGIRSNVFLLLANLYVDSFPRIYHYRPVNILKLDIQCMKIAGTQNAQSEMAELSSRLKESMMLKAERSYYSRPLSAFKSGSNQSIKSKQEPSYTNNQINQYKKVVLLIFQTENWTIQILKILRILINFSILNSQEKLNVYKKILDSMSMYSKNSIVIKQLLFILDDLMKVLKQDNLQKIKVYFILMHYQQKVKLDKDDIKYINQSGRHIRFDKQKENPTNQFIMSRYNEITSYIHQFHNKQQTIQTCLRVFLKNDYDTETMLKFIQSIHSISTPYNQSMRLLLKTSIIGQQDLAQQSQLEQYSLQVSNLIQISEGWLCTKQQNEQNYHRFTYLMDQITNYMYEDYILDHEDGTKYRKKHKINKFRQIVIKNIGMHEYILELLSSNFYLLQGQTLKTLNKKTRITFQKCFQFLYQFCYRCEQNKDILFGQMVIINKYINLLQVSQTQLWIHLIQNKKKLIQQISIQEIEKIIFKIIKNRISQSNANCDYNPLYIDQLMTLIDINGVPFKPNIEKIAKVLQQPIILKKILYLNEQKKKRNSFCLQLYKLRIDPTQIPVIYQAKMIELLVYMIKQLGSKNSHLRRSFKGLISIDYLFSLTSLDDSLRQEGIPTDMNFVLKIQALKAITVYLSIKEIQNEIYECIQITKFLEYFHQAFTIHQKKSPSMADNQMLYYSYIQKYEGTIQYYKQNNRDFYVKYLRDILKKLYEIFDKLPDKDHDENYQLVVLLLDQDHLSELKVNSEIKKPQKSIDVYFKWFNLMSMSQASSNNESVAKNILYQILTSKKTKQYLQQQNKNFFAIIQKNEKDLLKRIEFILTTVCQNFHFKPLYKLIFLFYEYIQYKISKPKNLFSSQAPSPILSSQFKHTIIPLIKLLCLKNFDYQRVYCQKIFHYSLLIIKAILSFEYKFDHHQIILKHLQDQNNNGIGLLKSLKTSLIEMIQQENIESFIQEVNFAQDSLMLISEDQKIQPLQSSLLFIKQLCRFPPFTFFFRSNETSSISFDFLEMAYNDLMTILSQGTQTLNIQKVKRIEYLCQTLAFFFNGCNKNNQAIVVNKDFVRQVQVFLKIEFLKPKIDKEEKQELLINEIAHYYRKTIPQYKELLKDQLNFFRFNNFYVMNCVKTELIKVLLASTIANELSCQKLKVYMSVELLKLNMIILHEYAQKYRKQIEECQFLQRFQKWRQVYKDQQNYKMPMTMPAYAFALIKAFEGQPLIGNTSKKNGSTSAVNDQIGQLENFLPNQMKILLKELKDQPFFRDILLFYQKYYEAYKYFNKFVASIEISANLSTTIVDITFSKIPLCNRFGADKLQQLQYETNRLNQQQKSKSFVILTQKFYQQIQGDFEYDQILKKQIQYSEYLLEIFKNGDKFYLLLFIINFCIVLLHLLANFELYSQISIMQGFLDQIFVFYNPKTVLRGILFITQLLNITFCTILIMFLAIKKLPFYFKLYQKSYHQLGPKQKIGLSKYQLTFALFNTIKSVFLDIYLVTFSALTIIHPMFASFIMLFLLTRLQLGQVLIKMVRALYLELLVVIGVLVVFNYCYAIFIYVNLTVDTSYGGQCVNLFVCMKLFMDQIIKGGFVTLLQNNYINNTITLQFFTQYSYNLLVPGVLIQIFRGINIDKMSYFREKNQFIEKNQKEQCYICGLKQFQIDLVLEGYDNHLNHTHNRLNYVSFIFYLKRKNRQKCLFYEDLVDTCLASAKYSWIPLQMSIKKQKIQEKEIQSESFSVKLFKSLEQKEHQARRILNNAKKTNRQVSKYYLMQDNNLLSPQLLSPTSPAKSKFSSNKSFLRS